MLFRSNVIKKRMCYRIGNGLNTWILEDPWIPNEPRFIPQAKSGISMDVHLMTDLIDGDTKQWHRGKLISLFEPLIVSKILNIQLPHIAQQDQVFWCLTPSGEFAVKSAYNAIIVSNSPNHPCMQEKD